MIRKKSLAIIAIISMISLVVNAIERLINGSLFSMSTSGNISYILSFIAYGIFIVLFFQGDMKKSKYLWIIPAVPSIFSLLNPLPLFPGTSLPSGTLLLFFSEGMFQTVLGGVFAINNVIYPLAMVVLCASIFLQQDDKKNSFIIGILPLIAILVNITVQIIAGTAQGYSFFRGIAIFIIYAIALYLWGFKAASSQSKSQQDV